MKQRKAILKQYTKNCLKCRKDFVLMRTTKLYCSKTCYNSIYFKNRRYECAVCGQKAYSKNKCRECWKAGRAAEAKENLANRFWANVEKTESCWIWDGCTNNGGYGLINVNGRSRIASRISYELVNGPVLNGLDILHKCDNPPCVNPSHLYAGTPSDNLKDAYSRNRKRRTRKLTQSQVDNIRLEYDSKHGTATRLGKKYGVTYAAILKIVRGETWCAHNTNVFSESSSGAKTQHMEVTQ